MSNSAVENGDHKVEERKLLASDRQAHTKTSKQHVLSIRGKPVHMEEDWNSGIGGGLWSTGLALAKYFDTEHAQKQLQRNQIRNVLELGSGNGFLAVCLQAAAAAAGLLNLENIVVTDTREHVPLMEATVAANASLFPSDSAIRVTVQEYLWGTGPIQVKNADGRSQDLSFDLIIGSDLAYRDELHDPLIEALLDCSDSDRTLTLLGVTMNDTKAIFFEKLNERGFRYERLADHLLDPSFRGTNFAIFVIQRQNR